MNKRTGVRPRMRQRVSPGVAASGQCLRDGGLGRMWLALLAVGLCWLPPCRPEIHLGGAIDLLSRYGYLSISMRVVPRNDSDKWIFREPTVDIFENFTRQINKSETRDRSIVFDGHFHMELCDNVRQLLQAYFRDFAIEKLDKPWRAFSGSWNRAAIARQLGINTTFVSSQHSYILVRVSRRRESSRLLGDLQLVEPVAEVVEGIEVGDVSGVIDFIRSFGSHYIASYMTGNSLYQVFVYTPPVYNRIKERLKNQGVSEFSSMELHSFFSPWYAEHIGKIQVSSGNSSVETWATKNLRVNFYFFNYPSLLRLHGDAELLKKLDGLLVNEAVLQLDLRTLGPAFQNKEKRDWFEEVLDNYLKLWEVNM